MTPVNAPPLARRACERDLERGDGRVVVARVDGASALVGCAAATPLQILSPRRRGASAWAVLASHGGGLLAGDSIHLEVDVGERARAILSTQAETKVYRSDSGAVAEQRVVARVADAGALALVPDPVSAFAGARYAQEQRFDLASGASLLVVDAVVAGRTARGERWAFESYQTRNEVRVDGALVVADALRLEPRSRDELSVRLGRFDAFAMLLALGPVFDGCAGAITASVSALPVSRGGPVLAVASPFPGGTLVRCAAATSAALAAFVHDAVAPAAAALGDCNFPHRW